MSKKYFESEHRRSTHPQLGKDPDHVSTAVLDERPGDDLHRIGDSAEGARLDTGNAARVRVQPNGHGHLGRTPTWDQRRVEEHVARDGHRISEIAVNLVQDILRRPTEKDRAGFWCLALSEEGEVSG